jgi:phosphoribosylglycinamide formyltransferase-1
MTQPSAPLRAVVMVSGSGSNLVQMANDTDHDAHAPYRIIGVIANRPDARALHETQAVHARTRLIDHKAFASRDAFDATISATLKEWNAELVLLAGFMRVLGEEITEEWGERMLNIHPSLLPLFPGLNTHQRALDEGVAIHGASVHQVTPALDSGPILGQVAVPVRPGDDAQKLQKRVLAGEHQLYPAVARAFAHYVRGEAEKPRIALSSGFD